MELGHQAKRTKTTEDTIDSDEEEAYQALPADATTDIIQTVIKEADRGKNLTKALKSSTVIKGVAVEEVEQAEEAGGVVLESKVAQTKKQRRKARGSDGADNTDLLPDEAVEAQAEEELEVGHLDGVEMEPFNLTEEREAGRFDASGHYLAHSAARNDTDAWLTSAEGNDVSERVRKLAEQQEADRLATEHAPEMSTVQIAQLKLSISEVLQSGETVTRGLQRLGALSGRGKRKLGKRQSGDPKAEAAAAAAPAVNPSQMAAARADFNRLTEAASHLMDAGELDVYNLKQEDFQKAGTLFSAAATATAAEADMFADDDMFADTEPQQPNAGGSGAFAATSSTEQDFSQLSVQQLHTLLQQRGQDAAAIDDRQEMVALAKATAGRAAHAAVPPGYQWDASTGYHYSPESQLFYDTYSGGYFNARDGIWYLFDVATQQFVLNPVQPPPQQ